jgi:hypothetical protein
MFFLLFLVISLSSCGLRQIDNFREAVTISTVALNLAAVLLLLGK